MISNGDIIFIIPDYETVAEGTERALIKDEGFTFGLFNNCWKDKCEILI